MGKKIFFIENEAQYELHQDMSYIKLGYGDEWPEPFQGPGSGQLDLDVA